MTRLTREFDDGGERREILGFVDVESGSLVLSDPYYLDRHWGPAEYRDVRRYRHRTEGRILQYERDFPNFARPIASEGGATMNELIAGGEWELLENPRMTGLSYSAASRATLGSDQGGQLVTEDQRIPAAVAVEVPMAHATLPVFVERRADGSPSRIWIDLPCSSEIYEDEQGRPVAEDSAQWIAYEERQAVLADLCTAMTEDVEVSSRGLSDQAAGR